jgi:hypothetical protein
MANWHCETCGSDPCYCGSNSPRPVGRESGTSLDVCSGCGWPSSVCDCLKPGEWREVKKSSDPAAPSVAFPEDPVVEAVLSKMYDRAKKGMRDYGVSMEDQKKPLVDWLDDAIEESLDRALYLEKIKRKIRELL